MHCKIATAFQKQLLVDLNEIATDLWGAEEVLVELDQRMRAQRPVGDQHAKPILGALRGQRWFDLVTRAVRAFERALGLNYRLPRAALELADIEYQEGALAAAMQHFETFNRNAKPTARSLCIGFKLAVAASNPDEVASYGLALKNLYPDQADQCQTKD